MGFVAVKEINTACLYGTASFISLGDKIDQV